MNMMRSGDAPIARALTISFTFTTNSEFRRTPDGLSPIAAGADRAREKINVVGDGCSTAATMGRRNSDGIEFSVENDPVDEVIKWDHRKTR